MTFQELKKFIAADQYRYEAGRGFKDFAHSI